MNTEGVKEAIEEYITRYNELLDQSIFFHRGTFDYFNAAQVAKALISNGFFTAKHTVSLNAKSINKEISNQKELEEVIAEEKELILKDDELRRKFDQIATQLDRNRELRDFRQYIQDNDVILSRLNNPEQLKQDVIKSYLKSHEELYADWQTKFDAAVERRKKLEIIAAETRTQWEKVIEIFNGRFVVPFELEAKNKAQLVYGQTNIIELGFTYVDGEDRVEVKQDDLLKSLSMGERKALYVLNVIFEVETRIKADQETLVIVDDIADSFDYQNKYAIIQYLKEISENGLFKIIIMTHNFDFFRTIESRFVKYSDCLVASKDEKGINLTQASGIRNVFARDWKIHFFENDKKKIASIPFFRNLVEMTTGEDDVNYGQLTAMLHWKNGSDEITVGDLDNIYHEICKNGAASPNADKLVFELIEEQADDCLNVGNGMNLENKVVLAIAIRLRSEKYMIGRIDDPEFVADIDANQERALLDTFKETFGGEVESIAVLERVNLMTPENIHLNSFMYEPIIDMSDDALKKLYVDVKNLK